MTIVAVADRVVSSCMLVNIENVQHYANPQLQKDKGQQCPNDDIDIPQQVRSKVAMGPLPTCIEEIV